MPKTRAISILLHETICLGTKTRIAGSEFFFRQQAASRITVEWTIPKIGTQFWELSKTRYTRINKCNSTSLLHFLGATTHIYKRLCPSVVPSVSPFVPCYFWTTNMAVFECNKSSNDIITNVTISDDEVVASVFSFQHVFRGFDGRSL